MAGILHIKVKTFIYDESIGWAKEAEKVIDYNNSSDAKWLGSHCRWAMNNNRAVCTQPIQESVTSEL